MGTTLTPELKEGGRAMATRVNDTQGAPPVNRGTEILARMLPARELAQALAAAPLTTVKPFLEDLKSLGDEDAMPDFALGAWTRRVVEFQDRMRADSRRRRGGPKPDRRTK